MARGVCSIVLVAGVVGCAAGPEVETGSPAGYIFPSRVVVTFEDTLGEAFDLVGLEIDIDSEPILACHVDEGRYEPGGAILIHDGPVTAGAHQVEVRLSYRGRGVGIFSYLRRYRFEVQGHHELEAPPDGEARLHIVAWERGEATTPLEDRPALRFVEGGVRPETVGRGCPPPLAPRAGDAPSADR